jgi:hypothetical protein
MQWAAQMDSTTAVQKVYRKVGWMVVCWAAQSVDVMVEMMAVRRGDWRAGRMDTCSAALKACKQAAM